MDGYARACEVMPLILESLGEGEWSIFGVGSLGYGGYVPGWSDLDLDAITDTPVPGSDLSSLAEKINLRLTTVGFGDVDVKCFTLNDLIDPASSVPYGLCNRRVMLVDSALHMHGPDIRSRIPRPSRVELHSESARIAYRLSAMPETWWQTRPLDDMAALLALPARLLYSSETGKVTDKQTAVARLLEVGSAPDDLVPWFTWALACRSSAVVRGHAPGTYEQMRGAARDALVWAGACLRETG